MIRVKKVKPLDNFILEILFTNNEIRFFDLKPFLNKPLFKELIEKELFYTAFVSFGTVEWKNGADIDPEFLYEKSYLEK